MTRSPSKKDLSEVLKKYPKLRIGSLNPLIIRGWIDIEEPNGNFWGKYQVEIKFPKEFPYRFPKIFEVGNKIPREADWHINTADGSFCTTVFANEVLVARKGITLLQFLDRFAVPFLANHKHKELTGNYANGEYSHGLLGSKEFFEEKFESVDPHTIFCGLNILLREESLKPNNLCFCKSGKKFSQCHLTLIRNLRSLPKKEVLSFKDFLIKNYLASN